MKKIVIFWVIVIFSYSYGCGASPKQTPKVQDTPKQQSDAITENRSITSEKQIHEIPSSISKNKTATQINNIAENQQASTEKRVIKIIKKDDLSKFGSEKRVALVIGNSDYKISPLQNPVNDANAMSEALKKLDFDVLIGTNLSQIEMKRMIVKFGSQIKNGGVGLFYYAGHGMQVKGRNYLIPIDAKIKSENDVDIVSVRADEIFAKMDDANNRLNIVILDACRNNPFARSFRSSTQGLATMDSPSGTLIAYATAPGSVASDGPEDNGLYTQELIKNMQIPDLKIEDMFKKIRTSVKEETNDQQIPWESSSLEGDFYFCLSSVILDKKMKKVTDEQMRLKKEIENLELLESEALKAKDARAKREAQYKKEAAIAKLKAEQLKQEQIEIELKALEEKEAAQKAKEEEMKRKKQEADDRLAALRDKVAEKRQAIGVKNLHSLSPEATFKEMNEIDVKINEIKNKYRKELSLIIHSIIQQVNSKFEESMKSKKDEFETNDEFQARVEKLQNEANNKQSVLLKEASQKILLAYNEDVKDLFNSLNQLSNQEFNIPSDELTVSIGKYEPKHETFPVSIKFNRIFNDLQIYCNAALYIPKENARTFKQYFENNIFRSEIAGNWQSLKYFRITKAYLINDATNEKLDIFSSKFVDIGNGIVYDSDTNLLWLQNADYFKNGFSINMYHSNEKKAKKAERMCENFILNDVYGWRLPSSNELKRMFSVFHNEEPHLFTNLQQAYWVSLDEEQINDYKKYKRGVDLKSREYDYCGGGKIKCDFYIWPVCNSGSSIDTGLQKKYALFSSKFIDLGNGVIYDSATNLLWLKNANHFKENFSINMYRSNEGKAKKASKMCENLTIEGLCGWRLPSSNELKRMFSVFHNEEPHLFTNLQQAYWVSLDEEQINDYKKYKRGVDLKSREYDYCGGGKIKCDFYIWPIRGGNPIYGQNN